jgi:hypothetical protein
LAKADTVGRKMFINLTNIFVFTDPRRKLKMQMVLKKAVPVLGKREWHEGKINGEDRLFFTTTGPGCMVDGVITDLNHQPLARVSAVLFPSHVELTERT